MQNGLLKVGSVEGGPLLPTVDGSEAVAAALTCMRCRAVNRQQREIYLPARDGD